MVLPSLVLKAVRTDVSEPAGLEVFSHGRCQIRQGDCSIPYPQAIASGGGLTLECRRGLIHLRSLSLWQARFGQAVFRLC